jgi:hypothetical protein
MIEGDTKPRRSMGRAVLVGFPFVLVISLALTLLFYAFGYRSGPGAARIPEIIGIVVGTQLIFAFQARLSRPSKRLVYASLACWGLLLMTFLARLMNLLPHDL